MFAASKTASVSGGYQISRSLRFNSADSAYLNRTPASATNQKTWTWSGWVKRSTLGYKNLFGCGETVNVNNNKLFQFAFNASDQLYLFQYDAGSTQLELISNSVYRDVSAWYHLVLTYDTTQATAANRIKLYVNNVQVTFTGSGYPSQNIDGFINSAVPHLLGRYSGAGSALYLDAYMTEVNFIDGQALTPSSFGETNAQTGVWQPKAYSGSYGTNGFYLNFSDNSNTTAATLGKDYSGNGNNWTPNNFSVTAGAGNDSLVDSPTSYGTDTGVGGTVRGNYATLNPLNNVATLANGNLDISSSTVAWLGTSGTILPKSGQWYWEMTVTSLTNYVFTGIASSALAQASGVYTGSTANSYSYASNDGKKWNNGASAVYGATYTTNDVIGIALDMDAGTLTFYKNGTSQGQAFTGISGEYGPSLSVYQAGCSMNFGQRPFAYTAPSGYKALCTQNLPTPTIGATSTTLAGKYFNPVLYTGNATTNAITGVGFQPDFVWMKNRASAYYHGLYDAVRGTGTSKSLYSNTTEAEGTNSANQNLVSFDADGFTLGATSSTNVINTSAQSHVAWNWKANGSGSTNTAGSITSTVSANTTSGFSVVTYGGNGANSTIGHGIGTAPSMVIVKRRGAADAWIVYHASLGNTNLMVLNSTAAVSTSSAYWNNTSPTSTVFTVGTATEVNANGSTYVAYCFAEVAGYSKFGSYTGNASADGPFVYCGFRPAYVMIKDTTNVGNQGNWVIKDKLRAANYNPQDGNLYANLSNAEDTASIAYIDLLSNGFKVRGNYNGINASGAPIIFMAFAEAPLKFSLAR